MLLQRYVSHASNRMRTDLAARLVTPSSAGITGPTVHGSSDVRALRSDGKAAGSVVGGIQPTDISAEAQSIRAEVDAAQHRGEARVSQSRRLREADTEAVGLPTKNSADRARSWGQSIPQLPENRLRREEDKPKRSR
jgi:hypothetical protein